MSTQQQAMIMETVLALKRTLKRTTYGQQRLDAPIVARWSLF
jgi:hypothetical protein